MATKKPSTPNRPQPTQDRRPQPNGGSLNRQTPIHSNSDSTVSRMQPARRDGSSNGGGNDKGK